jgi:hypothetical protein
MNKAEAINRLYDYNTELTNEIRCDMAELMDEMIETIFRLKKSIDYKNGQLKHLRCSELNLKTALNVYRNLS